MPNGRYGRYGYMPEMEGQGFFNPWMKNIDVAGGIGMLTNIIAQQQAQRQAMEQQKWQRQMELARLGISAEQAERQTKAEERQTRALEESLKRQEIEQTRAEERLGLEKRRTVATEKRAEKPTEAETREERLKRQQIERDGAKVKTLINLYTKERDRLQKRFEETKWPEPEEDILNTKGKAEKEIDNLNKILDTVQPMEGILAENPLSKEGHQFVNKLLGSMPSIKTGKYFKEVEVAAQKIVPPIEQKTKIGAIRERDSIIFNNKKYPINKDGTVTINGIIYKIQ